LVYSWSLPINLQCGGMTSFTGSSLHACVMIYASSAIVLNIATSITKASKS
jgi:hypothetical protein